METLKLIKIKKQEIRLKIKELGFDSITYHQAQDIIIEEISNINDKDKIHILLQVYKSFILEDKEKELDKFINNMKYFMFEK